MNPRAFDVWRGPRILGALLGAVALCLAGCDDGDGSEDGGTGELAATQPIFEPAPDPMDFGQVPFPDDLYLDDDGHIMLGALPSEVGPAPAEYPDDLRGALRELDGFSTTSPVFFSFAPMSLDAASLPATVADAITEDASVFLVDADPGSPEAFRRLSVSVRWSERRGLLALRPADGYPLSPGRRYAAVVTTAVRDTNGDPIGPGPTFLAIRDAEVRPDDPLLGEAYDQYTPVLSTLSANGVPREQVAALAVFTVQTVTPDLEDVRAQIWERPAPTIELVQSFASGPELDGLLGVPVESVGGLDVEGGVKHESIGWLVHGAFDAPWFASSIDAVHGRFRYDGEGRVLSQVDTRVPFTLTVPQSATEPPLVVMCHGIGSERSQMLAVADALAESGYAVLAIDLPFHGLRAAAGNNDVRHNYTDAMEPDGFGDRVGNAIYLDFVGITPDSRAELAAFHPVYPRDIFRQSVAELMTAVRAAREGDWSEVQAVAGLESLAFASEPVAFVGISLGGIIGTVFVASEPEVGAAALLVAGGDLVRLVERSAFFSGTLLPILLPKLGVDQAAIDYGTFPPSFYPESAIFQTLLDRGDAMSFAPILRARSTNVLLQMAADDETVPNSATEGLARAVGAQILDAEPSFTDLPRGESPASANYETDGARVTRGLYVFAPATHGLVTSRSAQSAFEPPPEPPFQSRSPVPVQNPVDTAHAQIVHFLDSWRAGTAEVIAP